MEVKAVRKYKINASKLTLICDEITETEFNEMNKYYNKIQNKKTFLLQRVLTNTILFGNKYLFVLVSGAITSLSVDILTRFNDYKENIAYAILLSVISLVFTASIIIFTAKINLVQECASDYRPDPKYNVNYDDLKMAQKNITLSLYYKIKKQIMTFFYMSIFSGIITIIFLLIGPQIIDVFKEVYCWFLGLLKSK